MRSSLILPALVGAFACGGGGDGYGGTNPPPPPAGTLGSIIASPGTINVTAGNTVTLTMQALSTANQPIANATGYTFTSSNVAVAPVSTAGEVLGLSAGTATVTASLTLGTVTKTVDVPVTATGTLPAQVEVVANASNAFVQELVAIARTGTVSWRFLGVIHNVDFQGTAGAPNNIGDVANQTISRTFNTAGNFNYVCTLHAGMDGSVLVR